MQVVTYCTLLPIKAKVSEGVSKYLAAVAAAPAVKAGHELVSGTGFWVLPPSSYSKEKRLVAPIGRAHVAQSEKYGDGKRLSTLKPKQQRVQQQWFKWL